MPTPIDSVELSPQLSPPRRVYNSALFTHSSTMPLSKATRSRIRQTRLHFTPLSSSSPAKDTYPHAIQDRVANVRYEGAGGREALAESNVLPTPEPSSQPARQLSESTSSPLSELPPPPMNPFQPALPRDGDEEEHDVPLPSTSRRRSGRLSRETGKDLSTPSRRSTRSHTRPSVFHPGSVSSTQSFAANGASSPPNEPSDLGSPETSGDEADIIVTKPAARRRQSRTVKDDDFVVTNDRIDYISSDDEPVARSLAKRPRSTRDDFIADDDEVEYLTSEAEIAGSAKRRRVSRTQKSPRTPRHRSRKMQRELEDDLEDLQDSESATRSSRTRGGPVTTKRDQAREHLEILKRRRAGEKVQSIEDTDGEADGPEGVDLDLIGLPLDIEDMSGNGSADSSVDKEAEVYDEAEEDDDFIEKDSPGTRPQLHPDIPIEFTSFASAKPRQLFPHVVEWLVKNKIAPAFSRNDQLWKLAFSRIDDQVKVQAGSRLISSAWNAAFKDAVLARPGIRVEALPPLDEEFRTCDACNKTNHQATYDFVFSGQAYYKDTLEPVETDSDDEELDEETENVSHDDKGHTLAPVSQHFYLGRFCAAAAEMGHKLTHWKFHLNESLLTYLEEQGVLSAEAIVSRDKKNNKRREKEAEKIVDHMEQTGMIAELWQGFNNDLDDARLGMEGYEKKGGRSRNRIGAVRSERGEDGLVREWREEKGGRQVRQALYVESDSD